MKKTGYALAASFAICSMWTSLASSAPIDNPGMADFRFSNSNAPFLNFASLQQVTTHSAGSLFEADVQADGEMLYLQHSMAFLPTNLNFGSGLVGVQLDISDLYGYTDLSGSAPDVDWEITARLRFNGGGVSASTCRTTYVTFNIAGDWNDVDSDPITFPALSGSGAGTCSGLASAINAYFGLGSPGATMTLYKFDARNQSTGLDLYGSP